MIFFSISPSGYDTASECQISRVQITPCAEKNVLQLINQALFVCFFSQFFSMTLDKL